MIALLTRALLLLQCLVALALAWVVEERWPGLPWPAALLLGLASVVLVRGLIAANNFRIASRAPPTPLPAPLGLRGAARLYFNELRATLYSSSWTMPFRRHGAVPVHFAEGLPVLLIHGYGCNSGFWWPLRRRLIAARISHHAVDLEPVLGDIDGYGERISAALDAIRLATGQERVVIVAHSMGGLVARAWLRRHGPARVARLITLGTPHHGTLLAHFGVGTNSRQMRGGAADGAAGSLWLAELQSTENLGSLPVVSIYSLHDNIIAPATSSHLPGARNVALNGIGHVALGSDPTVIAHLLAEIDAARQAASSIHSKPSC